jgi:hypothetical protein
VDQGHDQITFTNAQAQRDRHGGAIFSDFLSLCHGRWFQVINNFIPEFRKEAFSEFPHSRFSKRVLVAIGQPPAEFVARQR